MQLHVDSSTIFTNVDIHGRFTMPAIHRLSTECLGNLAVEAGAPPPPHVQPARNSGNSATDTNTDAPHASPQPSQTPDMYTATRDAIISACMVSAQCYAGGTLVPVSAPSPGATASSSKAAAAAAGRSKPSLAVDLAGGEIDVCSGSGNVRSAKPGIALKLERTGHEYPRGDLLLHTIGMLKTRPHPKNIDVRYLVNRDVYERACGPLAEDPSDDCTIGFSQTLSHRQGHRVTARPHARTRVAIPKPLQRAAILSGKEVVVLRTNGTPSLIKALHCAMLGIVPHGYDPETGAFPHAQDEPAASAEFYQYTPLLMFNLPVDDLKASEVAHGAASRGDAFLKSYISRCISSRRQKGCQWLRTVRRVDGRPDGAPLQESKFDPCLRIAIGAAPALRCALALSGINWDVVVR